MAIEDIFDCIAGSFCGLCCSAQHPCPTCEIHTLKANGLSEELAPEIRGLSHRGSQGFQYSPLYDKLKELMEEEKIKYLQQLEKTNPRHCAACQMLASGVKFRRAPKHTCGL